MEQMHFFHFRSTLRSLVLFQTLLWYGSLDTEMPKWKYSEINSNHSQQWDDIMEMLRWVSITCFKCFYVSFLSGAYRFSYFSYRWICSPFLRTCSRLHYCWGFLEFDCINLYCLAAMISTKMILMNCIHTKILFVLPSMMIGVTLMNNIPFNWYFVLLSMKIS